MNELDYLLEFYSDCKSNNMSDEFLKDIAKLIRKYALILHPVNFSEYLREKISQFKKLKEDKKITE